MGARKIPRDPNNEPVRDRRFKDKVRAVINSLLENDEIIRVGSNDFSINPSGGQQLGVIEAFSKKVTLPGLPGPVMANSQAILMQQIFTPRVSYGQVG